MASHARENNVSSLSSSRSSSRISSSERIGKYQRSATRSAEVLTPKQRRRAIKKSRGPERETLTDPDRWLSIGAAHRQAYLNPQQFKTMREIKQMGGTDQALGSTVEHLIPYKKEEVRLGIGDTKDYPALIHTMRKEGPAGRSVPPVWLRPNESGGSSQYMVGNGGHRIAIADMLGWKAMRYTTTREQGGFRDERYFKPGVVAFHQKVARGEKVSSAEVLAARSANRAPEINPQLNDHFTLGARQFPVAPISGL